MKVLTITPWYPHPKNLASGIFIKDRAIAVASYVESFLVHIYVSKDAKKLVNLEKFRDDGIIVYRITIKELPVKLHVLLYPLILRNLIKIVDEIKPDVLHSHVYTSGIYSIVLGRIRKIPVILTEHMKFQKTINKRFTDKIRKFAAVIILNSAQLVTVSSKFFKDYLRSVGVNNRIEIIQSPVNVDRFNPAEGTSSTSDKVKMLFVGWIDPIKGVDILLNSVKNLSSERDDFQLTLVGGGPNLDRYKELCKRKGLDGFVEFTGFKERNDVVRIMQNSDFLILPSLWEVFSMVVVEAMACGKPVVVSNKGQREIVTKKTGVVFDPDEGGSLELALNWMIDNVKKFSARHIRKYVVKKYSHRALGKRFVKLYEEVVENYSNFSGGVKAE